ncbi:MAG TPA: hypothetical protein VF482_14080 [Trebonia sp.]
MTLVIGCALLAGVIAVCGFQLSYGTYLGSDWKIAALGGMAAAVGLSAAVLMSRRRHGPAAGRFEKAWLLMGVVSASAIRYPFPQGRYGRVQAFFNVWHAALLGYEAVICTAIVALLAYLPLRPRLRARSRAAGYARNRAAHAGHALMGRATFPARLRFLAAQPATWRAGRLTFANGTVTWLSQNGDVEVDLTSACQPLPMLPVNAQRQPRSTVLATADGFVEVDLSPAVLVELVGAGGDGSPLSASGGDLGLQDGRQARGLRLPFG